MRLSAIILLLSLNIGQQVSASEAQVFSLLETEKWDEAIIELEHILTEEPNNPRLHYNLGVAFYRTHRYASAESAFKEALNLKMDDPEIQAKIYHNLGNTYFERGRAFFLTQPNLAYRLWNAAYDQYEISLEIVPDSSSTEENLQIIRNLLDKIQTDTDTHNKDSDSNNEAEPENGEDNAEGQNDSSSTNDGDSSDNRANENPETSNQDSASQGSNEQAAGTTPSTSMDTSTTPSISKEEALIFLQSLQNQEKRLFPDSIGWEQDDSDQPDW